MAQAGISLTDFTSMLCTEGERIAEVFSKASASSREEVAALEKRLVRELLLHQLLAGATDDEFTKLMTELGRDDRCEIFGIPILISAIMLRNEKRATLLLQNGFSPYFSYRGENAYYWALRQGFSDAFPLIAEAKQKKPTWRADFLRNFRSVSVLDPEISKPGLALNFGNPEDLELAFLAKGRYLYKMKQAADTGAEINLSKLHEYSGLDVQGMMRNLEIVHQHLEKVVACMPNPDSDLADKIELCPERTENKKFCHEKLQSVIRAKYMFDTALASLKAEGKEVVWPPEFPKKLLPEELSKRCQLRGMIAGVKAEISKLDAHVRDAMIRKAAEIDAIAGACKGTGMLKEELAVKAEAIAMIQDERSQLQCRIDKATQRLAAAKREALTFKTMGPSVAGGLSAGLN